MSGEIKKTKGRPQKEKNYNSPFAVRLRELVGDRTNQEVADGVGVSRQTVGQFVLGNTKPDIDTLCKLADFFGVSTDYLLCRTDIGSTDLDLKEACEFTGLSEKAVEKLHEINTAEYGRHYEKNGIESFKVFPNVNSEFLGIINNILNDEYFDTVLKKIHRLLFSEINFNKEPTEADEHKAQSILTEDNLNIIHKARRYVVTDEFYYNMMKEDIKSNFGIIIDHILDKKE